jgi:hypothetical protein
LKKPQFKVELSSERFAEIEANLAVMDRKLTAFEADISVFPMRAEDYFPEVIREHRFNNAVSDFQKVLKSLAVVRDWLDANRLHLEEQRLA